MKHLYAVPNSMPAKKESVAHNLRAAEAMGKAIIVATLVLFLFGGCSGEPEKKPPPPRIKVESVAVERGVIKQSLRASGALKFIANTIVSSEVAAQVKSIEVSDGQAVTAGQELLVFDDTKIRETAVQAASNLQKNEATLEFNRTELEKNRKLLETSAVSQTTYDQKLSSYQHVAAQVEADRAVMAKAMDDLKKTRVKAPISGRLSKRYIEKGDWVSESGKLFQISDFSRVYLEAYLSDKDLARLDIKKVLDWGSDAEVAVDSYPGRIFPGRLTYIEPVANATNLFQVRVYVDNPDMALLQGMFARGSVLIGNTKGVLRVPLMALMDQIRPNDANSVFVIDKEGNARLTRIKIGTMDRSFAQVLEGLNEADIVIVKGKDVVGDGQPVSPTPMALRE